MAAVYPLVLPVSGRLLELSGARHVMVGDLDDDCDVDAFVGNTV